MSNFTFGTLSTILCCVCGIEIQHNPANMCINCLRHSVDICEGISTQVNIHSCRSCNRFLAPPWQKVELESKELMALCLRKIPGLNKVKLIDASWIWTEPHSFRLKIKLTIQKEVMNGAVLQQGTVVEFTIRNQQCKDCEHSYAEGSWTAVVQVRQRVTHKRTFYFLEQLLLKHNAHNDCVKIVTFKDGMDFYFVEKQHAVRFIDFLSGHIPIKAKYSRKLISADHSNNIGKFKHNHIVEIVPVCKDDLCLLPKELAHNLSNISRMVLVKAIGAGIHIIDPLSGERSEISVEKYWRWEFTPIMGSKQLIRYVILSVEPVLMTHRPSAKQKGGISRKLRMAECVLAKESDFGVTDTQYTCLTHLGGILREGDVVLGFDLTTSTWTQEEEYKHVLKTDFPDVLLVRKHYASKGERKWKLRALENIEQEGYSKHKESLEEDYEEFLQELEGDSEMRSAVNLYKKKDPLTGGGGGGERKKISSRGGGGTMEEEEEGDGTSSVGEVEPDEEEVRLDELLDDLERMGGLDEEGEGGEEEAGKLSHHRSETNRGEREGEGEGEGESLEGDAVILSVEQASLSVPISVPTSGFEPADFPRDFVQSMKFT